MGKYLFFRILRGMLSVILVVAIVMILIYSLQNRDLIFATDPVYSKQQSNAKIVYKEQQWEKYGYVDYVTFADYLLELKNKGELSEEDYKSAVVLGATSSGSYDSDLTKKYTAAFRARYEAEGYRVERLAGDLKPGSTNKYKTGGQPQLYATKDIPVTVRLWKYFTGLITVDNIHAVKGEIENRGLTFTLFDPVYGGEKLSFAIMGNGTMHKYLLYFSDTFPYIHQNLIRLNLGKSYAVNRGVDVFVTMTESQGEMVKGLVHYPTGWVEETADDLHTATYVEGSYAQSQLLYKNYFVDDYTNISTRKSGFSRMGYSFLIGMIAVLLAYLVGVPLGTLMALKKNRFTDKLGSVYIIFIIAVPSLAYIFLFKAVGQKLFGLPGVFDIVSGDLKVYILPIISLALPSVAVLMKWIRRYMIDAMSSDYVKFARSGGLSEGEIFYKHIFKNAIIPIAHGIPGAVLGALVGAIITESVYVVPGTGNLLTKAINSYDNGVIVGVTLFYAFLSVISILLGDILMALCDPRISLSSKK